MNAPLGNRRGVLSPDLLGRMDAYWRAANSLTVGQIYLKDNPLLEAPLTLDHLKPRLLGHWGTTTGIHFLYVHLNRLTGSIEAEATRNLGRWLDIDAAARHCAVGVGAWDWAGTGGDDPVIVMACCGDVPTLETLAAVTLLRDYIPDLRLRVVNVVDLPAPEPCGERPHGLDDSDFDALFTADKPVVFAFHGYPGIIHRLTYRRRSHGNFHVRGYREEGDDDDALRHGRAEQSRSLPTRPGRHPSRAAAGGRGGKGHRSLLDHHATPQAVVSEHGDDMPEVRKPAGFCGAVVNTSYTSLNNLALAQPKRCRLKPSLHYADGCLHRGMKRDGLTSAPP